MLVLYPFHAWYNESTTLAQSAADQGLFKAVAGVETSLPVRNIFLHMYFTIRGPVFRGPADSQTQLVTYYVVTYRMNGILFHVGVISLLKI